MITLPNFSLLSCFPYEKGKPREVQINALNEIEAKIRAGARIIFVEGPTGTGKSFIAVALTRWLGNAYICTANKALQTQYLTEFPELKKVQGRANFECLEEDSCSCDEAPCRASKTFKCLHACSTKFEGESAAISASRGELYWNLEGEEKCVEKCNYWRNKTIALNAAGTVHNYKYLLTETHFIGDFGKRVLMISDEGHNVEKEIMSFLELKLNYENIEKIKKYNTDSNITFEHSKEGDINIKRLTDIIISAEVAIKNIDLLNIESKKVTVCVKDKEQIEGIKNKATLILKYYKEDPKNWIIKEEEKGVCFKPIFIKNFAYDLYFKFAYINVIMSATIINHEIIAEALGLENVEFVQIPSCIPKENNKIFNLNLYKMSYNSLLTEKDKEIFYKELAKKIDLVLQMHLEQRGIIHTVTKEIALNIKKYSAFSSRILTHDDTTGSREKTIEFHRKSKATVLCSPSMTEGVDLKDDLSRFQVFVKIPFLSLGDLQVKARANIDPKWYDLQTAINLIQGIGRSVRHENDYCTTYVFDSNILWFQRKPEMRVFNQHVRSIAELSGPYTKELKKKIQTTSTPKLAVKAARKPIEAEIDVYFSGLKKADSRRPNSFC